MRCWNCGAEFDEPYIERTTYESYYGVSGMFPNSTPANIERCPVCMSENFDNDEEDEEWED